MKVCKICGTMREPHASHRCLDNKLVSGRSSKMIPINTDYQYSVLSDNGEWKVKNKPYTCDGRDSIYLDLYEIGLKNISEVFNAKTVKEVFEVCSKLKVEHSVKYSKDFIHFDFEETTDCDSYTCKGFIDGLVIQFYRVNNYEK